MIKDIPQELDLGSEFLTERFMEKEVRDAIFHMKHNKAIRLTCMLNMRFKIFTKPIDSQ